MRGKAKSIAKRNKERQGTRLAELKMVRRRIRHRALTWSLLCRLCGKPTADSFLQLSLPATAAAA